MAKRTNSKTYYVQGMHCPACELLIEKKLEKYPEIQSAKASLSDKTVVIKSKREKKVSIDIYNRELNELGYTLTQEQLGRVTWDQDTILKAAVVFAILIIIFMFVSMKGYLAYISVTESSSLPAYFVFGLVAGFSSCAALVGGLLLSLSKQWNDLYGGHSLVKRSTPFVLFNVGRLLSYALFGGLLGLIGGALQLSIGSTAWLVLIVSVFMIVVGLQMLGVSWVQKIRLQLPSSMTRSLSSANSFQGKYMPFLAGASTFFLPCGFTLLAQTIALTTGSFVTSALIMFIFALGTLLPLVLISFTSMKFQSNPKFAGTFNLVVGVLIVVFGVYNINSQLVVLGMPNMTTILATSSVAGTTTEMGIDEFGLGTELTTVDGTEHQNAYMKAEGFDYYPRTLTLQSGVPTTLYIENENVVGCAQAMYLKGLYEDIVRLNRPEAQVSFTPEKGTYYISCSMGMVQPTVVTVL